MLRSLSYQSFNKTFLQLHRNLLSYCLLNHHAWSLCGHIYCPFGFKQSLNFLTHYKYRNLRRNTSFQKRKRSTSSISCLWVKMEMELFFTCYFLLKKTYIYIYMYIVTLRNLVNTHSNTLTATFSYTKCTSSS